MTDTDKVNTDSATITRDSIESFLYREARLQDEHSYDEWEALWVDDDAIYWVPMHEGANPEKEVSYIYDNRQRLASRIRQLKTGVRHSQTPQSNLRRLISNVEFEVKGDIIEVKFNFILIESRRETLTTWAGQTSETLIMANGEFRIKSKKIVLVNSEEALSNLAFLI